MQQGSKQGEGSELDILMIAAGITVLFAVIYYFFHNQIVHFLFMVKYYELQAIDFFTPSYVGASRAVEYGYQHPEVVGIKDLLLVSKEVGAILKYPLIAVSLIFAVVLYVFHPDRLFSDFENMHTLGDKMAKPFPAIQVIQGLDLVNEPINTGPWAMALTPIEFAKKHKLIYRDPDTKAIKVDRVKAKLAFTTQLGRQWQGVEYLAPHEKAIFGILASFANYDRDSGDKCLAQIATSANKENLKTGKLNFSGAHALAKKYGDTDIVKEVAAAHGYVTTVFSALLTQARRSGTVANSMYLWLKPLDRRLWYTLNSVGRKAVFVEVGGIHGHLLAENELEMAIKQPMVEEAIYGLEEAVAARIIKDL